VFKRLELCFIIIKYKLELFLFFNFKSTLNKLYEIECLKLNIINIKKKVIKSHDIQKLYYNLFFLKKKLELWIF